LLSRRILLPPVTATQAIALRLFLPSRTVEHDAGAAVSKIGVTTRADVAVGALQLGLVSESR
jgi:DNA-binding NarL/FixJ family response regulator